MYRQLLGVALHTAPAPATTAEALARARRCRRKVRRGSRQDATGSGEAALVDELAYDRALIQLAHRLHIPVEVGGFESRTEARERLEVILQGCGVELGAER